MADNHQLWFGNIRVVPFLRKDSGLGIIQRFITHFITRLIDEVERNGDSDAVVGEVKSSFSVFRSVLYKSVYSDRFIFL